MEQSSLPTGGPQTTPESASAIPSAAIYGSNEHLAKPEQQVPGEQVTVQSPGVQQPPMQLVAPPPQVQPVVQQTQSSVDDNNPLVADDVDVIEKEWIDRAKQIVNETRDDPYAQEQKVSVLQSDYLKKRYGKDIKPSVG